jgi:hypothetical protein
MNHDTLQKLFIKWFQENHPEARILENRSGKARINKELWIPYGMPSTGGGSDLMAFYPGGVTEFYEVKTKDDIMRPDQIKWANCVTGLGFKYFIVRETERDFTIESYKSG